MSSRSPTHFKVKAQVRVCEMWTATCIEEVCEGSTNPERSFVMGWPTCNCVAMFRYTHTYTQIQTHFSVMILQMETRKCVIVMNVCESGVERKPLSGRILVLSIIFLSCTCIFS